MVDMLVVGIDEVGRGALAGPLIACAYGFGPGALPPGGLRDSKKMTRLARERCEPALRSIGYLGIGSVSAAEIDSIGIQTANMVAMRRAMVALAEDCPVPRAQIEVIVDGVNLPKLDDLCAAARCEIDADANHPAVCAASVVAKVNRDALMKQMASMYPGFGFDRHVGYGSALHMQALRTLGVTEIHRRSFAPVARAVRGQPSSGSTGNPS